MADEGELGPLLFERRTTTPWGLLLGAVCAFGLFVGTACVLDPEKRLAGVIVVVVAVAMGLGSWLVGGQILRFHEHGVAQRRNRRWRALRYDKIATLRYHAWNEIVNGAHRATHVELTLAPADEGLVIEQRITSRGADEDLDDMRDRIAQRIAHFMSDLLRRDGAVRWTSRLFIRADGIELYRTGLLFSSKKLEHAPWDVIARIAIENGELSIWIGGESIPAVREATGAPNFFPGLALFTELRERARAERDREEPET